MSFGVIDGCGHACPARFLELVHRLDKETSGVLLVAKRRAALLLQEQFSRREVGKTYAAVVAGSWPASRKVIDLALHKTLDGAGSATCASSMLTTRRPGARSRSWPSAAFEGFTPLDVTIKTGRTHQIRVHLAHEGHPIVGDPKYGDFALNRALARGERLGGSAARALLHARKLRFEHPATRQVIELQAPLPAEFTTSWWCCGRGPALTPIALTCPPTTPPFRGSANPALPSPTTAARAAVWRFGRGCAGRSVELAADRAQADVRPGWRRSRRGVRGFAVELP